MRLQSLLMLSLLSACGQQEPEQARHCDPLGQWDVTMQMASFCPGDQYVSRTFMIRPGTIHDPEGYTWAEPVVYGWGADCILSFRQEKAFPDGSSVVYQGQYTMSGEDRSVTGFGRATKHSEKGVLCTEAFGAVGVVTEELQP